MSNLAFYGSPIEYDNHLLINNTNSKNTEMNFQFKNTRHSSGLNRKYKEFDADKYNQYLFQKTMIPTVTSNYL
jgi:hypothetical protein